jgi:hypothetical protein
MGRGGLFMAKIGGIGGIFVVLLGKMIDFIGQTVHTVIE